MNRLVDTFRALKYRNFRLFFPGLILSQIGIWLQNIAIGWLVYDMTKSAFLMGLILFFNTIPLFLITPFAGVIIDKFNKHKLLMFIQTLFSIQACLIAVCALLGILKIWNIIILGVFLNSIAAVDVPLRQSTFVNLVDDKKDLSNAISLNSTCFNIARLLGPAIAGVLIAKAGTGICFLANSICFLPSLILVPMMKINDVKSEHIKNETIFEGLKEGFQYMLHNSFIETLLVYIGVFSFLGMTYPMLMPIYTQDILKADADTLGLLMSLAGIGALFSSLILAYKKTIHYLKTILCVCLVIMGVGFIGVGSVHNTIFACVAMFLIGVGMTGALTPANTLIQTEVEDEKRGRVMSIHAIFYLGTLSLSNFTAGTFTHYFGISGAFKIFGMLLIIAAAIFACIFIKITKKNMLQLEEKD